MTSGTCDNCASLSYTLVAERTLPTFCLQWPDEFVLVISAVPVCLTLSAYAAAATKAAITLASVLRPRLGLCPQVGIADRPVRHAGLAN